MKSPSKTMHAIDVPAHEAVPGLLGDLRKLPLLPATAQEAMTLATQGTCTVAKFTAVIERDVTLASSVLKLANSPVFNWGRSIDCVDQAVIRLGMQECKNLMVAVSMRELYSKSNPTTRGYCSVLWSHCFLTACLARRLNQEVRFNYRGEEFAAGLLHDLGRILIAVAMPNEFTTADPMSFEEDESILEHERSILGTDHCELGCLYAEENGLPVSAVTTIRDHHRFAQAAQHRGIVALVVAADHMANHVQRGEDPQNYNMETNPAFDFLTRVWSRDAIASFVAAAPRVIRETTDRSTQKASASPAASPAASRTEPEAKGLWGTLCSWL